MIHYGDINRFQEEEARLRSLSNVLEAAGWNALLFEDFAEEVTTLIRELGQSLLSGKAGELLLAAFNDEEQQNYIITYVRVSVADEMTCDPIALMLPSAVDRSLDVD